MHEMKHQEVTDPSDARLDPVRALRSTERATRAAGRVIAESPLTVARVLEAGHRVERVVATPAALDRLAPSLAAHRTAGPTGELEVVAVAPDVLDTAVGFELHRGAVAVVVAPSPPHLVDLARAGRRLAVIEGVIDLENLGVLFRSAAALGLHGIVVGPGCGDPWGRRAVRVSVGTSLDVPWCRVDDVVAACAALRDAGHELLALTPSGDVALEEERWAGTERLAVMLGAEGTGLSEPAMAAADHRVAVPMARAVDSLNVAAAAAIAFWATRPRPVTRPARP